MELDKTNSLFWWLSPMWYTLLGIFFSSVQLWTAPDQQREAVTWHTGEWKTVNPLSPFFSLLFSIHPQITCDWKSNGDPDQYTLDSEYSDTLSFRK